MNKHTPGPGCLSDESPMIIEDKHKVIVGSASTYPHSGYFPSENEAKANARLSAAAPELLEALEMLYAVVQGECPSLLDEDSGGDSRLDIAIAAAIAKAKGEQP